MADETFEGGIKLPAYGVRLATFFAMAAVFLPPSLATAAVNDVFPSDYAALPEGDVVATAYYYHRRFDGFYRNGQVLLPATVRADIAAIRLSRFYRHGGVKWAPTVVAPAIASEVEGDAARQVFGGFAGGMGDLRASATFWAIDNPGERHFLALTLMLIAPTGEYSSARLVNVGENRWRQVGNLGWINGWGPNWTTDVTAEVARYGDNPDYNRGRRLEQEASSALTAYIRHHFSKNWQGFAGTQFNWGGDTHLDGVPQGGAPGNQRIFLGGLYLSGAGHQVIFRYGRDAAIDNGFHNDQEWSLRFLKRF